MYPLRHSTFAIVIAIGSLFILTHPHYLSELEDAYVIETRQSQQAAVASVAAATSTAVASTTQLALEKATSTREISTSSIAKKPSIKAIKSVPQSSGSDQVHRTEDPYDYPALSLESVNEKARSALVNILCTPRSGSIQPISGSGIIIDPRGVILTNAHVAQYVLLSQSAKIDLNCVIRTGSPAVAKWRAGVLYIPPVWVEEHAKDINNARSLGTGAHDYALLLVHSSLDGSPLPTFPYTPFDTREAIAFESDPILTASYPVEFIGGLAAQSSLYPVSSISSVRKLLTLGIKSVDLLSLGGVIGAQGGSSGGGVFNSWNQLVGIIVTTSDASTTGERDLRALTLAYINRDMINESGQSLHSLLAWDVLELAIKFENETMPRLLDLYLTALQK